MLCAALSVELRRNRVYDVDTKRVDGSFCMQCDYMDEDPRKGLVQAARKDVIEGRSIPVCIHSAISRARKWVLLLISFYDVEQAESCLTLQVHT